MKNDDFELVLTKCCLCGHLFPYEGYPASPVNMEKGAVCCEYCYDYWVFPASQMNEEIKREYADYGE